MKQTHVHDVLRQRLLTRAGLVELPKAKHSLTDLAKTEWSPVFEQLMRNRLIMGALRYGLLANKKAKQAKRWDLVGAVRSKVASYESTGNTEFLVDAANYLLLVFECDPHPNKHFLATDDTDHCKTK